MAPSKSARFSTPSPSKSPSKVVDISSDGDSPVARPLPPWIPELQLTQAERSDLLAGEWTNDKVVDAVNKLLAAHVGTDPAQSSVLTQSSFAAVRSDTTQIVYDTNHWVATAFVEDEVYVANSLGNNISPLVSKQLKELYVSLPSVSHWITGS